MAEKAEIEPEDAERPFLSHLLELRSRLMRSAIAVIAIFLCLYPFSERLYGWFAGPLVKVLPAGSHMIATKVADTFLVPMKLSLILAIFLCMPYLLYQLWSFVAPGLYKHERRLVWPLMAASVALFYIGAAFAYFVVFPLIFKFFTSIAPEGVLPMTDMGEYLSFVLTLFFAFGAAFQVPIATILLVKTGVVTRQAMAQKRPYVVVAAFFIGMVLTPPDIVSQVLLAVPIWMLYEIGLWLCRFYAAPATAETDEDEEG